MRITKALIRMRRCTGRSAPVLLATPEDRFSCMEAQLMNEINFDHVYLNYSKTLVVEICTK